MTSGAQACARPMHEVILAMGLFLSGCAGDDGTSTSIDQVPSSGEPLVPGVGAVPVMESPSQTTSGPDSDAPTDSSTQTDPNTQTDPAPSDIAAPESPPAQAPSEAEIESTPEMTPPESDPPMVDVESAPELPDDSESMNEAVEPDVTERLLRYIERQNKAAPIPSP